MKNLEELKEKVIITKTNTWKKEFSITIDFRLTDKEMVELQKECGYHPAGYGFYEPEIRIFCDEYHHTWHCANSCD